MKKLLLSILFLAHASVTLAENMEEKRIVLKQAEKYASTVACSTGFEDGEATLKDVFSFGSEMGETEGGRYLVLWRGDVGCSGGSGTMTYQLSIFSRISSSRPFLAENGNILEGIAEINSRFIESVEVNGESSVIVTALAFAEGDGNRSPSKKFRYWLSYEDSKWIVDNKMLINNGKKEELLLSIKLPTTIDALEAKYGSPHKVDVPEEGEEGAWGQMFEWKIPAEGLLLSALGDDYSQKPNHSAEVRLIEIKPLLNTGEAIKTVYGITLNKTKCADIGNVLNEKLLETHYDIKFIKNETYNFFKCNDHGVINEATQTTVNLDGAG